MDYTNSNTNKTYSLNYLNTLLESLQLLTNNNEQAKQILKECLNCNKFLLNNNSNHNDLLTNTISLLLDNNKLSLNSLESNMSCELCSDDILLSSDNIDN